MNGSEWGLAYGLKVQYYYSTLGGVRYSHLVACMADVEDVLASTVKSSSTYDNKYKCLEKNANHPLKPKKNL